MQSSVCTSGLRDFIVSKRGHMEARQGLSAGLVTGALAGLAVTFGTAERAQADYCYGIPEGQCAWTCEAQPSSTCQWEPTMKHRKFYYCHSPSVGCYNATPGTPPCDCA